MFLKELGSKIAGVRVAKNITQEDLSDKAGVSLRTLRRIETGQNANTENLMQVLVALNLDERVLNALPSEKINPLALAKGKSTRRVRSSPTKPSAPTRIAKRMEAALSGNLNTQEKESHTLKWGDGKAVSARQPKK